MALEDVCNLIDPPRERLVVARMRDANADERPDVVAHQPRIEARHVAEDHAARVQLADAVGDGGLRQPHRLGDLHLGRAGVVLKQVQDLIIYRI